MDNTFRATYKTFHLTISDLLSDFVLGSPRSMIETSAVSRPSSV
jgi:hypothetical protein